MMAVAKIEGLPRVEPAMFLQDVEVVARCLLNCILVRSTPEGLVAGRISETEAYSQEDPASHSYRGMTARNSVMFGRGGRAYVYFTYGMHYCLNAVCGPEGRGEGVLLRSVEAICGLELMHSRRRLTVAMPDAGLTPAYNRNLVGGPGRLCSAFEVDLSQSGNEFAMSDSLWIAAPEERTEKSIVATPRIGVTRGAETLRRFVISGDLYTSRPAVIAGVRE